MNPPDTDRILLLERCATGDSAALRTLYDDVAPQLFSVLLRILRRRDLAEEALQEVFISVWRNAASYKSTRGSPMTWLVSIARYRALDVRRSLKGEAMTGESMVFAEETVASPEPEPLQAASDFIEAKRLEDCMRALTPQQDKAIRLAFVSGLSYAEVAHDIGSPLGSVKSWIRRGMQALKKCLG